MSARKLNVITKLNENLISKASAGFNPNTEATPTPASNPRTAVSFAEKEKMKLKLNIALKKRI